MTKSTIKLILTGVVLIILISIALSLLRFAIRVLLPIAILVIAAYIIYMLVKRK